MRDLVWVIVIGGGFEIGYLLTRWVIARRRRRASILRAQRDAVAARDIAVSDCNHIRMLITEYAATGKDVTAAANKIEEASHELASLLNSLSYDPAQPGLTAGEYENIRDHYDEAGSLATAARVLLNERVTFEGEPVTQKWRRSRIYAMPERAEKEVGGFFW